MVSLKSFINENTVLVFLGMGVIGIFFLVVIQWQILQLKKRLGRIFGEEKSGKSLEEFLEKQVGFSKKLGGDIEKLFHDTETLRHIATKSIHKVGVVRFNPFQDTGGDQSFVVALLDAEDNGFVISSLHLREGTRIYTKPVEQGASKTYKLTQEEQEAIKKAKWY